MKIRHIIIIAIFVLANIIILATLNFNRDGGIEEQAQDTTLFLPTLSATKITNGEEQFAIEGYGTISSFNAVDIACEVQGQLQKGKYHIKPGISFRKGDLLFKVNDIDARYNLRSRKSSFINIIANLLPDLNVDFPEEYNKWNNYIQAIKLNEPLPQLPAWRTSKEKIFLSTQNVLTEYFNIKSLEEQVRKYAVYAPFSGVVTTVYTSDYAVVNPGTRIMRIVETGNFEIPVAIPANQLAGIEIGTDANVYSTTGEHKGVGTVVRISEVINKNTQSVDVYVKPKNLDGKSFIEGEYVNVRINQTKTHLGMRLPKSALVNNGVYIYSKKDSTLNFRPVSASNENNKGVFVQGLKDNSIVITQEVLNYTDSAKYKVLIQ